MGVPRWGYSEVVGHATIVVVVVLLPLRTFSMCA